jgi:hypothetical protein
MKSLDDIKYINSEEEFDQALELMQQSNFLINLEGKAFVLVVENNGKIILTEPQSFKLLYKYLKYTTPIINTTRFLTKYVSYEFLESPKTKRLNELVFDPKLPPGVNGNKYNMWSGFKYKPKWGETNLFHYLIDVNCNGDAEAAEYFLKYCALAVQKPWVNPRTAIAIIGDQGSGKGTLINDTILKLTENSVSLKDLKPITGEFNNILKDAFFVCLDECSFGGDIKEANLLKTFISEDRRLINEKYKGLYTVDSYTKTFILSNNDYIVNVEETDRRYVVLRANNKLRGKFKWFANYQKWLNNGGYEAIMNYLLYQVDITDFNPLDIPKTEEKVELQLRSADLPTKFIRELLEGMINFSDDMYKNNRLYKKPLYEIFVDYCKRYHPKAYIPSIHDLNKVMTKAFQYDNDRPGWRQSWKDREGYYYLMPSIEDYQEKFAKNIVGVDDYKKIFTNQKKEIKVVEQEQVEEVIEDIFYKDKKAN